MSSESKSRVGNGDWIARRLGSIPSSISGVQESHGLVIAILGTQPDILSRNPRIVVGLILGFWDYTFG